MVPILAIGCGIQTVPWRVSETGAQPNTVMLVLAGWVWADCGFAVGRLSTAGRFNSFEQELDVPCCRGQALWLTSSPDDFKWAGPEFLRFPAPGLCSGERDYVVPCHDLSGRHDHMAPEHVTGNRLLSKHYAVAMASLSAPSTRTTEAGLALGPIMPIRHTVLVNWPAPAPISRLKRSSR